MAEQAGRRKDALRYYTEAVRLEDALPEAPSGSVRRHLARVAVRQRRGGEARELLHDALLRNPYDALSMRMPAELYLAGGEDPDMAELLCRKVGFIQSST